MHIEDAWWCSALHRIALCCNCDHVVTRLFQSTSNFLSFSIDNFLHSLITFSDISVDSIRQKKRNGQNVDHIPPYRNPMAASLDPIFHFAYTPWRNERRLIQHPPHCLSSEGIVVLHYDSGASRASWICVRSHRIEGSYTFREFRIEWKLLDFLGYLKNE